MSVLSWARAAFTQSLARCQAAGLRLSKGTNTDSEFLAVPEQHLKPFLLALQQPNSCKAWACSGLCAAGCSCLATVPHGKFLLSPQDWPRSTTQRFPTQLTATAQLQTPYGVLKRSLLRFWPGSEAAALKRAV